MQRPERKTAYRSSAPNSGKSNEADIPKSSIWTSVESHGFVPLMSEPVDDRLNLIRGLFLEAGRLMEGTSAEFALAMPNLEAIAARTLLLDQLASDHQALTAATRALLRVSAST